ncbi:MAG: zinc metalloprotease HtpX [Pseudomonadota bacterium]
MPLTRHHKLKNLLHSALLIIGMAGIAAACAWTLWGLQGVVWGFIGVALGLMATPSLSPEIILGLYRGRPLPYRMIPELHAALEELSRRAGLPAKPALYYVPSEISNAFAVGRPEQAAIALTGGMLRTLSPREIVAVMAHEISHLANNDLWIMNLADSLSRLTTLLSYLGIFLLALNLPLLLTNSLAIPWLLIALLILAPSLLTLLQLALSRAREYDADLDAVQLCGDPEALATALEKLERSQGGLWENLLRPNQGFPQLALLRGHPPTPERVRRLMELKAEQVTTAAGHHAHPRLPLSGHWPPVTFPFRRWPGLRR